MKITKFDIGLFILFIIAGLISLLYVYKLTMSNGKDNVVILQNGKVFGTYPIEKDQTVEVKVDGHTNKINIKNRNVQMAFSTCANQDCIRQGKIHDSSKSIICLPNKVVVEIEGKEGEFDSVTR